MKTIVYKGQNQKPDSILPAPSKEDFNKILIKYGRRINESALKRLSTGHYVVYSCPQGKIAFITGAALSSTSQSTVNYSYMAISVLTPVDWDRVAILRTISDVTSDSKVISVCISPVIPIIVNQGENVFIYNYTASGGTTGSVTGYEIDAAVFFSLI